MSRPFLSVFFFTYVMHDQLSNSFGAILYNLSVWKSGIKTHEQMQYTTQQ